MTGQPLLTDKPHDVPFFHNIFSNIKNGFEWLTFIYRLPRWLSGKESVCQCRSCRRWWVWFLGREDPLEKEMATHSSIQRTPWTKEPGRLQSMGSQRVRHDWAHNAYLHTHRTVQIPLQTVECNLSVPFWFFPGVIPSRVHAPSPAWTWAFCTAVTWDFSLLASWIPHCISVHCCCNTLLKTKWLQTTQMYCLTVLQVRSLKWVSLD